MTYQTLFSVTIATVSAESFTMSKDKESISLEGIEAY